jgi:hypothetical protein
VCKRVVAEVVKQRQQQQQQRRLAHLLNHVHELSLRWILSKRPHNGPKLLGGDGA